MNRHDKIVTLIAATVCLGLTMSRIGVPVLLDNAFIVDTLFVGNLGWRGVNGLRPVIDYPHHYGGGFTAIVVFAFKLFGANIKSIDYAYVLLFFFVIVFGLLVATRRISVANTSLLLVLTASLILAPNCIEDGFTYYFTHSFAYNHVAVSLMMFLTIFVSTKSRLTTLQEIFVCLVSGGVLFFLILLKTPFAVFAVFFFVGCVVNRGLEVTFFCAVGFAAATVVFDPGFARTTGSLGPLFLDDIVGDAGGVRGRALHSVFVFLAAVPIIIVCVSKSWAIWKLEHFDSAKFFFALSACFIGFFVSILFMNGLPYLKLIPILVVILILQSDRLRSWGASKNHDSNMVALILAAIIVIPGTVMSARSVRISLQLRDYSLIESGPYEKYLMPYIQPSKSDTVSFEERLAQATKAVADRKQAGIEMRGSDGYVIFADGIHLLRTVRNIENYRIVTTDGGSDFSFAMEAPIVTSFPVWQLPESVQSLDFDEVEIVMEGFWPLMGSTFSDEMMKILESQFIPCRSSEFFRMHVRVELHPELCD